MKSIVRPSLLLAIAAGMWTAAPATAQTGQQTPENAHRFLSTLANENRIGFETPSYFYEVKFYSSTGYNGEYRITSRLDRFPAPGGRLTMRFLGSGGCKSTIEPFPIAFQAYQREADTPRRNITIPGRESWHDYIPHLEYINANGIDWSRLSSVAPDGAKLTLNGGAFSGGAIYLYFESPEMATRAAYAIEVIRQSCDPVASTGF
ncbi:hypothetical protein [Sphingopyxis sp. KK2]|uniref:hypothetical protein n=1 Tax=Sphingopyxis sp. KK2 TaxID=1855727 RepID=UPI00097E66EF|nr:hypothetical protein [Sphingopyxis sp. KK2]